MKNDRHELNGVKAVFFDLFNTLARFWPPRDQVQAEACREFGIVVNTAGIDRGYALADALMAEQNARAPLRTLSRAQTQAFFARYEQLVLRGAGVDVDLALAERVWDRVRQVRYGLALFDDVLPSLARLRESGLTIGVISNMNRPGPALARDLGFQDAVQVVVTSHEVGVEKPDPAMFQAATARAGVTPREAAHVGDQPSSDVDGARAAGLRPVLMDRYRTTTPPPDCPVVHDMAELELLFRTSPTERRA
ncbi:MAG: HAD family hydrolase [SAR202 cluster bacterium]|nr:HAD family hydrolase [SAR202 cluster bacterium]